MAALLAGDAVSAAVAAAVAVTVVAVSPGTHLQESAAFIALFTVCLPAMFAAAGLYPGVGVSEVDEFRLIITSTSSLSIALLIALALVAGADGAKAALVVWVCALVVIPLGRAALRRAASSTTWWGVPVVVLGAGRATSELLARLATEPRATIRPIAILDDDPELRGTRVGGVPIAGSLDEAPRYVERGVQHALVPMQFRDSQEVETLVHKYASQFPTSLLVPELAVAGAAEASVCSFGGLPGVRVRNHLLVPRNLALKRLMDLVCLVPAGMLAFPIVGLAALVVRAVNPGDPFYSQERIGLNGKRFRVLKIRTMYLDAEERLERYLAEHSEAREEWRTRYKLSHDARILPVIGTFLRASSLDELPQLWNIARGEMSFVGPRPFPAYHLEAFDEEFQQLRASVTPGLTGLWQITSRSDSDLARQQELDRLYISNWSPWLDAYILARTPGAVIGGHGAE